MAILGRGQPFKPHIGRPIVTPFVPYVPDDVFPLSRWVVYHFRRGIFRRRSV